MTPRRQGATPQRRGAGPDADAEPRRRAAACGRSASCGRIDADDRGGEPVRSTGRDRAAGLGRAAPQAPRRRPHDPIVLALAAALLIPTGFARAQEASVDAGRVEACFEAAAVGETQPGCIGAASNACQRRPGGDTTIGITECVAAETAAWDEILNREYRATRDALDVEGEIGIDTGQALLDAQRAWIAYRDAECALTYARWQGGTIRSIAAANCHLVFTATRAIELRDMRGEG